MGRTVVAITGYYKDLRLLPWMDPIKTFDSRFLILDGAIVAITKTYDSRFLILDEVIVVTDYSLKYLRI